MTRPFAISESGGCVVRYGDACERIGARTMTSDGAWRCTYHAQIYAQAAAQRAVDDAERERVRAELAQSFIRIGDGPVLPIAQDQEDDDDDDDRG